MFLVDEKKLLHCFEGYKTILRDNHWWEQEKYKWEAVKCFHDNWDINAENFGEMLHLAIAKTDNLLHSSHFFADDWIFRAAELYPDEVRKMFRNLFDESLPLKSRIHKFRADADEMNLRGFVPGGHSHDQDIRACFTYLWLHYPEKYYIYKIGVLKSVSESIGYDHIFKKGKDYVDDNIDSFMDLYGQLRVLLKSDRDIKKYYEDKLQSESLSDEQFNTVTIDFGYFVHNNIKLGSQKIDNLHEKETSNNTSKTGVNSLPLNQILYGPPGTGKTYNTKNYAVATIEKKSVEAVKVESYKEVVKRYDQYVEKGQIQFVTFHQSYSYEDFVEGIRPVLYEEGNEEQDSNSTLRYKLQNGVFKSICNVAKLPISIEVGNDDVLRLLNQDPSIWKVSLKGTGDNEIRSYCLKHGCIRVGFDEVGEEVDFEKEFGGKKVLNAFMNRMQIGDIVLSCYSSKTIDAIGVVTGDYEWHEYPNGYNRQRAVKWIYKGEINILNLNQGKTMTLAAVYKLYSVKLEDVVAELTKHGKSVVQKPNDKRYVLIIDEINRGNISKIFGELITLIEEDKRETLGVTLPYSQQEFTVPKNLYIIGTMNTADRSIAALDIALRRRFTFKEMMPDMRLVPEKIDGIDLRDKFIALNKAITILLDRDHQIGHSYFMGISTINELKDVWFDKIIPLLNEYFYGDWDKLEKFIPGFILKEDIPKALQDGCDEKEFYSFVTKDKCDNFDVLFGKLPCVKQDEDIQE